MVDKCHYIWYYTAVKGNEKLVQKFLTNSGRITVEDCEKLLTSNGYEFRKSSGSHRAYHKKGRPR